MFIGRDDELHFFEERYKSKKAELIVLYGRRRVGKTETLREFCKNKPHVFYSCLECSDRQQLESFSGKILKTGIQASNYITSFSDWETAFRSMAEIPHGNNKKLIIIDEFPYMCKGNSSIPSIIQNLWDESLKNENIMIILCGSAMSFIEKELLAEKNPLYGRATGIYKMKELSFYDAIQFTPDYNDIDKIIIYAVLGGIPHYLNQFDNSLSLAENIKRNILTKGCILYSEIEFLLRQELRETAIYNTIIESVALGNTKLNDIYTKTQIEKAKISVYLNNLNELEITEREFSISDNLKQTTNTQRGLYKLTDNFFRFWYRFVFANYSELENGDVSGVYEHMIQPYLNDYTSYIFEDICKEYMRELNKNNRLPFRYSKIGRWWGKTTKKTETEIDIMAVNNTSKNYIIGECKFKNKQMGISDLDDLRAKYTPSGDVTIYYYLFSKTGFTKELLELRESNFNIFTVSLVDLVHLTL